MGSIYLHCDPTASHCVKLTLDAIFGAANYRNEIVWQRTNVHNAAGQYGRIHDILFFYTKGERYTWNTVTVPYGSAQAKRYRRDEQGRLYTGQDLTASRPDSNSGKFEWRGTMPPPSRGWGYTKEQLEKWWAEGRILAKRDGTPRMDGLKVYFDEMPGKPLQSVWTDIPRIPNTSPERLGYPTQKPEALLERIIAASSNEGDLVLDPFCGCGTTVVVAERLKRRWIGIDITHLAITLMRHRLHDTFGPDLSPYEVIGDPKDLSSARALAEENRYQFEWWALGLVDARPAQDKRKGADRGVDGYINFFDDNSGKAKTVVVQVKSGGVTRNQVATLNSDREREKAPIGILITLEEPTRPMLEEAVTAGSYEPEHFPGYQYPRIQILTIRELLEGKEAQYPRMAPPATFKRAQRHRKSTEDQQRLV
jgi:site-specific DNA-methyltransferase (adenine-specific)